MPTSIDSVYNMVKSFNVNGSEYNDLGFFSIPKDSYMIKKD